MRVGDRIDARTIPFRERWLLRLIRNDSAVPQDQAVTYSLHRGAQVLAVTIVTTSQPATWSAWNASTLPGSTAWTEWIGFFAQLWALGFAVLLAVRRPDLMEARLLVLFLVSVFGIFKPLLYSVIPSWPQADFVIVTASYLLWISAPTVLFTLFTTRFTRPLSRVRRALTVASLATTGVSALIGGVLWIRWYGFGLPDNWDNISSFVLTLMEFAALACAVAAIIASSGAERQRIAWATVSIAPLWLLGAFFPNPFNQQTGFMNQQASNALNDALGAFSLVVPVGLTYAVLSRRIIDTGYVINRTAIFAGVSFIILAVFVVLEWALGTWLSNVSHTTSIAINIIVALALGLAIRPIHGRVESVIDRVFFRKRHEDETALRRFADEATFITDPDTLLDRTVEEVKDHADLDHVGILLQNGAGTYDVARGDGASGPVSENDPAILAMRSSHEPIDLQSYKTAVDGDLAFPLLARGKMLGVLVCGSKSSREPYAPDEADALHTVAHGVGLALDGLRNGRSATLEEIQGTLKQILDELRTLPERLGNGRPAIDKGKNP